MNPFGRFFNYKAKYKNVIYLAPHHKYKINDIYLAKVIKANQKKNSMIYHLDVYR